MKRRKCYPRGYLSLSAGTHERLVAYCKEHNVTIVDVIESLVKPMALGAWLRERDGKT